MALSAKMQFTEQSTRYDDSPGNAKTVGGVSRSKGEGKKKMVNPRYGGKTEERSRRKRVHKYETVERPINRIIAVSGGHRHRTSLPKNKRASAHAET